MEINGVKYYWLLQKAWKIDRLRKYCAKDKNFISNMTNLDIGSIFDVAQYERNDQIKYLAKNDDCVLKGNFDRILANFDLIKQAIDDYKPPAYKLEDRYMMYPAANQWFFNQCLPDKERRLGLVIYSKERCLGKTMFAKSLVQYDERAYVICQGNFEKSQLANMNTAKLLILDDMEFMGKNKEAWKQLVTG